MPDRQDFFAEMTTALNARAGDGERDAIFQPGKVKVRLIEAHPAEPGTDGATQLLRESFERHGLVLEPFADDLVLVRGDNDLVLAIDTIDPRFWQVFSTSLAEPFSRAMKRVLSQTTLLDSAWMPKSLLQEMDGTHRWLKSSFESDDLLGDQSPTRRWRARFEGDAPDELLELLGRDPRYARASALAAIGSTLSETGVGAAQLFADWQGTFTIASGDFNVGASAITRAAERYANFVRGLEDRYRLQFGSDAALDHGITLDGDVAVIPFDDPVADVGKLVEGMFLAKEPFRLVAVPKQIDDNEWEANAVDLHVGQPLRLEISSYRVRVLLGEHTCGNTLARLLTNLQHRLDARVALQPA